MIFALFLLEEGSPDPLSTSRFLPRLPFLLSLFFGDFFCLLTKAYISLGSCTVLRVLGWFSWYWQSLGTGLGGGPVRVIGGVCCPLQARSLKPCGHLTRPVLFWYWNTRKVNNMISVETYWALPVFQSLQTKKCRVPGVKCAGPGVRPLVCKPWPPLLL